MFNEPLNIVIIEDEKPAQRRLVSFIKALLPNSKIKAVLSSVQESVLWFQKNEHPSLIFLDIELADGNSFLIFESITIECPIIFTTAYNEYAIKAFAVNSIDYLLKPYTRENLIVAIDKLKFFRGKNNEIDQLKSLFKNVHHDVYKENFMVKSGQKVLRIVDQDIAYFVSEEKMTWLITIQGKKYIYDTSLEQLEEQLDPYLFFRVSRKHLVSKDIITGFKPASSHRVELILKESQFPIFVSKERVKKFKNWLEGTL